MSATVPLTPDLVNKVGERIKHVRNVEVRDLIWQLTEIAYSEGIEAGKAYAAAIESFNRQATEEFVVIRPEDEPTEPTEATETDEDKTKDKEKEKSVDVGELPVKPGRRSSYVEN